MLGRFTGKQCRDRWFNHLSPALVWTPWTSEEDALLVALFDKLGRKWAKIKTQIPGRSAQMCKQRHGELMSKKPSAARGGARAAGAARKQQRRKRRASDDEDDDEGDFDGDDNDDEDDYDDDGDFEVRGSSKLDLAPAAGAKRARSVPQRGAAAVAKNQLPLLAPPPPPLPGAEEEGDGDDVEEEDAAEATRQGSGLHDADDDLFGHRGLTPFSGHVQSLLGSPFLGPSLLTPLSLHSSPGIMRIQKVGVFLFFFFFCPSLMW